MRVTKGVTRRVTSLATYRRALVVVLWSAVWIVTIVPRAAASNAPDWMRALVGVSLPSYDEKTDAVLLYSETSVTVLSVDKIRTRVRAVTRFCGPKGGNMKRSLSPSIRAEKSQICMPGAFRRKARTTR